VCTSAMAKIVAPMICMVVDSMSVPYVDVFRRSSNRRRRSRHRCILLSIFQYIFEKFPVIIITGESFDTRKFRPLMQSVHEAALKQCISSASAAPKQRLSSA
jgi:hypothetical protein